MSALSDGTDQASTREVWAKNRLHVQISRTVGGGVRFDGQDFSPNPFGDSEYEYAITVDRADVPTIIEALGGQPGDDVLALIEANIETIVRTGEQTWLTSLGISPAFWSHV